MTAPSSERAAIRQTIRALKAAGHTLHSVWDGEETTEVKTETEAIDAITAVDEAQLVVSLPGDEQRTGNGYIIFVLGNDPEEAPSDYTVNLSGTLDPLFESWWS